MSLPNAEVRVRPLRSSGGGAIPDHWLVEVGVCGVWRELPTTAVDIALRPGELPKVTLTTIRADVVIEPVRR